VTPTVTEPQPTTAPWEPLLREIEGDLARRLDSVRGLPGPLRDALRYAAFGGGKRLRPILVLLACESVGGRRSRALVAGSALELIHTFSLVHDDLPSMDDDHLRRGRPTLHVHAGEAMAILAGDCLQALAFEWVASSALDEPTRTALARELGEATVAMIAGQVFDTLGGFPEGLDASQRLELIHRNKTAALLRAACRMGACCGGATEPQMQALTRYGESVGMMFQIVDDLLDVTQTTEHLGKAAGKDGRAGKLTYPLVHGTAASRQTVQSLRVRAHEALEELQPAAGPLLELCDYMAVRTR
jgi:geranylgeranyl diphosphate synthase type II